MSKAGVLGALWAIRSLSLTWKPEAPLPLSERSSQRGVARVQAAAAFQMERTIPWGNSRRTP